MYLKCISIEVRLLIHLLGTALGTSKRADVS